MILVNIYTVFKIYHGRSVRQIPLDYREVEDYSANLGCSGFGAFLHILDCVIHPQHEIFSDDVVWVKQGRPTRFNFRTEIVTFDGRDRRVKRLTFDPELDLVDDDYGIYTCRLNDLRVSVRVFGGN